MTHEPSRGDFIEVFHDALPPSFAAGSGSPVLRREIAMLKSLNTLRA